MSNVSQNNNKIEKAFNISLRKLDTSILRGFESLLQWGMEECLKKHDAKHQHHIEWGDTYGWMLYYNGTEIKRFVTAKGENNANANEALNSVADSMKGSGWHGIILAGMQPRKYFVQREEIKFMRNAILSLKSEDFGKYFRAI